jgi:hypothetical protein
MGTCVSITASCTIFLVSGNALSSSIFDILVIGLVATVEAIEKKNHRADSCNNESDLSGRLRGSGRRLWWLFFASIFRDTRAPFGTIGQVSFCIHTDFVRDAEYTSAGRYI